MSTKIAQHAVPPTTPFSGTPVGVFAGDFAPNAHAFDGANVHTILDVREGSFKAKLVANKDPKNKTKSWKGEVTDLSGRYTFDPIDMSRRETSQLDSPIFKSELLLGDDTERVEQILHTSTTTIVEDEKYVKVVSTYGSVDIGPRIAFLFEKKTAPAAQLVRIVDNVNVINAKVQD